MFSSRKTLQTQLEQARNAGPELDLHCTDMRRAFIWTFGVSADALRRNARGKADATA
jgi:hypothetical protein